MCALNYTHGVNNIVVCTGVCAVHVSRVFLSDLYGKHERLF